jgi:hypothetical protein
VIVVWTVPSAVLVVYPDFIQVRVQSSVSGTLTNNITVPVTQTSVFIGLSGGASAMVSLAAYNSAGFGPASPTLVVRGPAAAPSGLLQATLLSATDSTIIVTLPACQLNGASIDLYSLTFTPTTGASTAPFVFYSTKSVPTSGILPTGTAFSMTWRARNSAGWSASSPALPVSTKALVPNIVSFVASKVDVSAPTGVYGSGIMLTVTFDGATNQSAAEPAFNPSLAGSVFASNWTSDKVLTLRVTSSGGVPPVFGRTVVALTNVCSASDPSSCAARTSPALSGNFGVINTALASSTTGPVRVLQTGTVPLLTTGVILDVTQLSATQTYLWSVSALHGTVSPSVPTTGVVPNGLSAWLSTAVYTPDSATTNYFGSDGISLKILSVTMVEMSSVVMPVSIMPVNHAPVITAPQTLVLQMGSDFSLAPVTVSDVDTLITATQWSGFGPTSSLPLPSTVPMSVNIQSSTGSFNTSAVTAVAIATTTRTSAITAMGAFITLTGTVSALNTAFANIRYSNSLLTSASISDTVTITVNDNANGGQPVLFGRSSITVIVSCSNVGAPNLLSARIADTTDAVVLTFDRVIVLSVLAGDARAAAFRAKYNALTVLALPCSQFIQNADTLFGPLAMCAQTDGMRITARLTKGNPVVSSTVALSQPLVRACATSNFAATGSVSLLMPLNPPVPSALITAPETIGVCADFVVNSRVTGAGTFAWSGSNGLFDALGDLSTSPSVRVSSLSMQLGTTYTVTLVFTSLYGVPSTPTSLTFTKSANAIPQVSFLGPTAIATTPSSPMSLTVKASASLCAQSDSLKLSFSWSFVPDLPPSVKASIDLRRPTLNLPAGVLLANTTYAVSLVTAMASNLAFSNTVTAMVTVTASPLQVACLPMCVCIFFASPSILPLHFL